jgi:alkyl hydroperoxide reductase subunit F
MGKIYDVVIIGGGPAGAAAAVYAGRKKLDTLLIAESIGGQSIVSNDIHNWIGEASISGHELAQKLEQHVRAQAGIKIRAGEKAQQVSEAPCGVEIKTDRDVHLARTLIICSGGRHRKLNIPGEEEFNGRGVAYCSTCDAPFYQGKTVVVVGGGNSGLEAVIDLEPYADKIYMIHNTKKPAGDPATWQEVKKIKKFEYICCRSITGITGQDKVEGFKYVDEKSGQAETIAVDGVFVEIGSVPNSEMVSEIVERNNYGEVMIDHKTGAASHPNIFAAGDVTDEMYKQNNIAAGDGVRAALSAYFKVLEIRKEKSKMADCELTRGLRKK